APSIPRIQAMPLPLASPAECMRGRGGAANARSRRERAGSGPEAGRKNTKARKTAAFRAFGLNWSGRQDLNLRLLRPERSALPGWATPRGFEPRILGVGGAAGRCGGAADGPGGGRGGRLPLECGGSAMELRALIKPRTPPGVMELLPRDQIAFQRMLEVIRRNYERFGFLPVETPVFELSEVLLTKSGGDTERQVYFVQS